MTNAQVILLWMIAAVSIAALVRAYHVPGALHVPDTDKQETGRGAGHVSDASARSTMLAIPPNSGGIPLGVNEAAMPRYRCHKTVSALKILAVVEPSWSHSGPAGSAWLTGEGPYPPVSVTPEYVRKHNPQPGGYYVVYDDGYKSFSPASAFEAGYTRI